MPRRHAHVFRLRLERSSIAFLFGVCGNTYHTSVPLLPFGHSSYCRRFPFTPGKWSPRVDGWFWAGDHQAHARRIATKARGGLIHGIRMRRRHSCVASSRTEVPVIGLQASTQPDQSLSIALNIPLCLRKQTPLPRYGYRPSLSTTWAGLPPTTLLSPDNNSVRSSIRIAIRLPVNEQPRLRFFLQHRPTIVAEHARATDTDLRGCISTTAITVE